VAVDLKPLKALKNPVTLAALKADKNLKNMPLIRIPRLSVMPLTPEEFVTIVESGR